jgi:hypothetical protein
VKFPLGVLVLICAGVVVAIAQPLTGYGNAIRPGLGDLMNGVATLVLLLVALGWALITRKRR